jgi:3-phenylpropionate/trans-cinnamate dioxygenase ferredoxin reductase subunit
MLADKAIELRRGQPVIAVERRPKQVRVRDGAAISYDTLVLATGGVPKTIAALPIDGRRILALRTLADARALGEAARAHRRFLVVGGGWLGLEVAAVLAECGKEVVIVETAARLCARSLPAEVSQHLRRLHESRGNMVLTGVRPEFAVGAAGIHISGHGRPDEAFDAAIVAVGMRPRDELATSAGLKVSDGIVTDVIGRTNDPHVYAIGDVASGGRNIRLESWRSAVLQGRQAARAICGLAPEPIEAPWFWSEQCGCMIQIAGLPEQGMSLLSLEAEPKPLWSYGRGDAVDVMIGIDRAKEVRRHARVLATRLNALLPSAAPALG